MTNINTKEQLAEKWDTEVGMDCGKLVDDMIALYQKYGHNAKEIGVVRQLDMFFHNKNKLIQMWRKHKDYKGNLRIYFPIEISGDWNSTELEVAVAGFCDKLNDECIWHEYKDENGKTLIEYQKIGMKQVKLTDVDCLDALHNREVPKEIENFLPNGVLKVSNIYHNENLYYLGLLSRLSENSYHNGLTDEYAKYFNQKMEMVFDIGKKEHPPKFGTGMKVSRAFQRILDKTKVEELYCTTDKKRKWYNAELAKIYDLMKIKPQTETFVMSLNPMDYATMSFGVSWASCHTIDKQNRRRREGQSYSGCYCGGTQSYMLDESSIITYTEPTYINESEWIEYGKIRRCMFHVGEYGHALIQGRVYPQGNDGNTDLYRVFRSAVQKVFADLWHLDENKWIKRSDIRGVFSSGRHYRDYDHFSDCNLFYRKPFFDEDVIEVQYDEFYIGRKGICLCCGNDFEDYDGHGDLPEEWLLCNSCGS